MTKIFAAFAVAATVAMALSSPVEAAGSRVIYEKGAYNGPEVTVGNI